MNWKSLTLTAILAVRRFLHQLLPISWTRS